MKTLRERMVAEMQRRDYSKRTIDSYIHCVARMSKHFNRSPEQISIEEVKDYLHQMVTVEKRGYVLVNQTINGVRLLFKDVLNRPWTLETIKRPKKKSLPIVLSPEEALAIVNAPINIEHRTILHLGYSAGLRIGEVINLKVEDIDSKRMQIRIVSGKGKKDRYTILSKNTLLLLREYFQVYRPKHQLFQGLLPNSKYTSSSINKILKRARKKAGLTKRVTFHTLRHSFATHLLEQGTNLQIILRLLGHSNISTTNQYLHVRQYTLDKVVSPMDVKS